MVTLTRPCDIDYRVIFVWFRCRRCVIRWRTSVIRLSRWLGLAISESKIDACGYNERAGNSDCWPDELIPHFLPFRKIPFPGSSISGAIKKGTATSCTSKARQSLPVTRKRCPCCQEHRLLCVYRFSKLAVLDVTPKVQYLNTIHLST